PPGDSEALAEAIARALDLAPEERRAMAARAIEHIRKDFTSETMAARTLAVYEKLLRDARGARARGSVAA
ncbi:MAG TPA: glycosyltransferase, partial [Stellaceae bacterium]|nr:glycosyltransferase [Stellaceae bacterium]